MKFLVCKLENVQIESSRVSISQDAWLGEDVELAEHLRTSMNDDKLFQTVGLSGQIHHLHTFKKLLKSDNLIFVKITESSEREEKSVLSQQVLILLALSALKNERLVAGFDEIRNTENAVSSISPCVTIFRGSENGELVLRSEDEGTLRRIYETLKQATLETFDDSFLNLLGLYCGCIVSTYPQNVQILNFHFGSIFGGVSGAVIYGSMFFEHIFTETGWMEDVQNGVKIWNKHFPSSRIDWEDIKIIQKYRTTFVHSKPQKAQQYVKEWCHKHKVETHELSYKLEAILTKSAKSIMRTILLNPEKYQGYRKQLDKKTT